MGKIDFTQATTTTLTEEQIADAINARGRAGQLTFSIVSIDLDGTAILSIARPEIDAAISATLLSSKLIASGGTTYETNGRNITATVRTDPVPSVKRPRKKAEG